MNNTKNIPNEILDNPNINFNDVKNLNYLNDLFGKLHAEKEYDINNESYKKLLVDINDRIDSEYKYNNNLEKRKSIEKALSEAKKELEELKKSLLIND